MWVTLVCGDCMKLRWIILFLIVIGILGGCLTAIEAAENASDSIDFQPPVVVDQGWSYSHSNRGLVDFVFIVENPNQNIALERNLYQVTAYSENGTELGKDSGWIAVLFPGERLGVGAVVSVPKNKEIAAFEVLIGPEKAKYTELIENPLKAGDAAYIPYQSAPMITGIIDNSMGRSVSNVRVSAVAYDDGGNIIGGGVTPFLNFVPAMNRTGVTVGVASSGVPAKVELYPSFYQHSVFRDPSGRLKAVNLENLKEACSVVEPVKDALNIEAVGFVQQAATGSVYYAFVVDNPNDVLSFYNTNYRAVAYDREGRVLEADSGIIGLVFAGERMGVTGDLQIPREMKVARMVIDIDTSSARPVEMSIRNPLTAERVTYLSDQLSPRVTGVVKNSLDRDVQWISVSAITYDEGGKIMGIGFGSVDFVLAGGQAAVAVFVYDTGKPARLELYPKVSNPSDLGADES